MTTVQVTQNVTVMLIKVYKVNQIVPFWWLK